MQKSLLSLYEDHIYFNSTQNSFSNNLWGKLPQKVDDIQILLREKIPQRKNLDITVLNDLKSIVKSNLSEYGTFTKQIKDRLKDFNESDLTLEIGHQPLFFGGGSFVFNKISYAIALSQYLEKNENLKVFPFLFIGDHDQVQNELTITRFPQFQSYTGLEIKYEYDLNHESTPMAYLPLNGEEIFLDQCDKIRSNYRELFRFAKIKNEFRPLLEERLESIIDLFYESYLKSKTFSEWLGKFWSNIFIIKNHAPIFILKASDIKLRKLLLPYLEELLIEENRIDFINTINDYHDKITQEGYKPGLPLRDLEEAPFFYECPNCEFKSRIKLEKINASLQGKCQICNEKIVIEYDIQHPDLSDHYQYLSPRVESRSIIINRLLKAVARITGGGETTYHAQIIPFMRKKQLLTPLILKNPRIYYNTPWSERIASEINFDNLKHLQNPETFKLMASINKASTFDELKSAILKGKNLLTENMSSFQLKEEEYRTLLKDSKNKNIQKQLDLVQLYQSHNFGTFQPEKTIQEVSWNWIDLSILTGMKDIFGFYARRIKKELPLAPTFWLSVGKYN